MKRLNDIKKFIPKSVKRLIPKWGRRIIKPGYNKMKEIYLSKFLDSRMLLVRKKLRTSKMIIDLGCGNNPIEGATFAVDLYLKPMERACGAGHSINIQKMKERRINFIIAKIDSYLPFKDKQFDFAYSSHVFEHTDDPATACKEMMRIAKSGTIMTPSILAELIFGREYHRWLVMDRGNTIFFFRKRSFEYSPFGEHPKWSKTRRKWLVDKKTNPFDILLNLTNWYAGKEKMPRLSKILRHYWVSRSPIMEVIFIWKDKFNFLVFD